MEPLVRTRRRLVSSSGGRARELEEIAVARERAPEAAAKIDLAAQGRGNPAPAPARGELQGETGEQPFLAASSFSEN